MIAACGGHLVRTAAISTTTRRLIVAGPHVAASLTRSLRVWLQTAVGQQQAEAAAAAAERSGTKQEPLSEAEIKKKEAELRKNVMPFAKYKRDEAQRIGSDQVLWESSVFFQSSLQP